MRSIQSLDTTIHFNTSCYEALIKHLEMTNYSKIFILVDQHTHKACLEEFSKHLPHNISFQHLEIPAGEHAKTIDTCQWVWNELSRCDADRKSLMINLGGGVVTDLGAFVASTFKRGIAFINVPTSLLAMVDASVGGKTGVDLGNLKNQIGTISLPHMVLVDTLFLKTLPDAHFRSGLAEMLKHGLITDKAYWRDVISSVATDFKTIDTLIYQSVQIKNDVVTKDPFENGLRKTLNYGHTLGHAIESYFLNHPNKQELLHGEAIAIGMVLETYISQKLTNFPAQETLEVKSAFSNIYGKVEFNNDDITAIIDLLKFDKKNSHGNINFVLLEDYGKAKLDQKVSNELILEAFEYYNS